MSSSLARTIAEIETLIT
ncbi:hypothetical protein SeMB42_g00893, partial [Synchytrium endobioticum]